MQQALSNAKAHLYLLYIPNPDNKVFTPSEADDQWKAIESCIGSSIEGITVVPLCGATRYVGDGGDNWAMPKTEAEAETQKVFPDTGEPNDRRLPYALWFMTVAHPLGDGFLTSPSSETKGQLVGKIDKRLELAKATVVKRAATDKENDPSAKVSAIQANSINAQAFALKKLKQSDPFAVMKVFAIPLT